MDTNKTETRGEGARPTMETTSTQPYGDRDSAFFRTFAVAIRSLSAYHQHRVVGLDNIPPQGPGIVVANHSLATYDTMLLGWQVAQAHGRELLALVDRLAVRAPITRTIFRDIAIEGSRQSAEQALRDGKLILVMPGGMREMLRDSANKYRVDWAGRRGFVRISLNTGAPIILAACPQADDIFEVYPNPVTRMMYSRFKLPLPVFRGLGPTMVPRKVSLTHLLSEPIVPQVAPDQVTEADVEAHHERIVRRMDALMEEALAIR